MASCPKCASNVPSTARFCPRCGEGRPDGSTPVNLFSRPGVPWAGIAFVLGIVFAPAAVISGFYWHTPALIWTGVAATAVLLLVVVLAHIC